MVAADRGGTDSGEALVGALLEEMRRREIVAPALSTVERLAWEGRSRTLRVGLVLPLLEEVSDGKQLRTHATRGCPMILCIT